ncbi:PaaI family thioesterase [Sphingomonas sp. CFBP 13728]|uniref:PaaI family thioesterase n=1 Tax=Sphingomonas sp. CFBP 13728 TaxID=2775294 RepID=UPI00177D6F84|nr:PaaI family thioesterase [Sphingomonas sp. CFBP 13728]MBD8619062.1 PaaI family thioesterase [Sphingomonas sp. CFBP 13728]
MTIGLPPYAGILRVSVEAEDGAPPVLLMPFADDVLGRPGFLHGGAISGLLEMAAIAALQHALKAEGPDGSDARIKPVNVTVDFMRGGRDKPTRAAGVVTRLGNRVANVEATAWQDERDKPIAAARMNYLIVRD